MAAENPVKDIITSDKFQSNTRNIVLSFLEKPELVPFANSSKVIRNWCEHELTARKMLHLVLNPDENNVKKLKEMIQNSLLNQENHMVGADPCVHPNKKQKVGADPCVRPYNTNTDTIR